MTRQLFALAFSLVLPAALLAQDKFGIKINHGSQGDIYVHAKESTQAEAVTITGPDGNVLEDKKKNTIEVSKYREEILEKVAGKRATKVKRVYTVATRKVDGETQKHAYHEKTVMIELKDGKYVFTIDGKELSQEEAGDLAKNFDTKKPNDEDMDKMLLPTEKVAVGDAWKIDATELVKLFGDDDKVAKILDASKAKGSGKLIKAYQKDGHQFGSIEYKIEVPLKALEGVHPCRDGSKIELTIAGDMCIDGSVASTTGLTTSHFVGTADVVQDDKKTGVTVKFDVTGKEKATT